MEDYEKAVHIQKFIISGIGRVTEKADLERMERKEYGGKEETRRFTL